MRAPITVYGTDTCGDTIRTRRHLEEIGAKFHYVNIDDDPQAEELVLQANRGKRVTPTVVMKNGPESRTISEPEDSELDMELDRLHLLPQNLEGDRKRTHGHHPEPQKGYQQDSDNKRKQAS